MRSCTPSRAVGSATGDAIGGGRAGGLEHLQTLIARQAQIPESPARRVSLLRACSALAPLPQPVERISRSALSAVISPRRGDLSSSTSSSRMGVTQSVFSSSRISCCRPLSASSRPGRAALPQPGNAVSGFSIALLPYQVICPEIVTVDPVRVECQRLLQAARPLWLRRRSRFGQARHHGSKARPGLV